MVDLVPQSTGIDVVTELTGIETKLMELHRKAQEEKRQMEDNLWLIGEQLLVVREAKAKAAAVAGAVGIPSAEVLFVPSLPREIVDPSDHDYGFLRPAVDPGSGDPIYDPRAVSGYNTMRERARAAACVYGRNLREGALARAIFDTGETSANDSAGARSSLGTLVRYGEEWTRLRGWLYYVGTLERNEAMIRELAQETPEELNPPVN